MSNEDVNIPLVDRGKSLLEQLLRIAQTRLEMLSIEVQREKMELARTFRLALAAAVCAWLAGLALIMWIALSLPADLRSKMLAGLFIVLFATTIALFIALKRHARREPLFERLIDQLQMDRTSLGSDP